MKLNERATAVRTKKTEGEVPPISVEETRKQLGKLQANKTCDQT